MLLFFFLVLAGWLRGALAQQTLEWEFGLATGAQLQIGSLETAGATAVLRDVRLRTARGAASLYVAEVDWRIDGHTAILTLDRPNGRLLFGHNTLAGIAALKRFLAARGARSLQARVIGGDIALQRGSDAVRVSQLDGTLRAGSGPPDVDLHGKLNAKGTAYPFEVSGNTLQAASLPVSSLWGLLPASSLSLQSGIADRVNVAFSPAGGSLHVTGASGTFGSHAFDALHGTVLFGPSAIGSAGLDAQMDGVPLHFSGEADDITRWSDALRIGTPDLRALARIYGMIAPTADLKWINLQTIAPGIAFGQYQMMLADLPRIVQLITIDPNDPRIHFDTALSSERLISGGERTTQMGLRTGAVAGINGDYFDIGATYQPQGMLVEHGDLVRGPVERMALVIDRHNHVFFHDFTLRGHIDFLGRSYPVTQFNDWPLGYVTVITPRFAKELPATPDVRFLALAPIGGDRYRITSVTPPDTPIKVSFGVALGHDLKDIPLPRVGETLTLAYHLEPHIPNIVAGIGGGPLLMRNGMWYEDPHAPAPDERDVRWPVDALGLLADKTIVLVAVDGRRPGQSVGMTRPEFGALLQGFGITDAMALDSGGSVTLVARSPGAGGISLHNVPSDFSAERYISDALFVYSGAPAPSLLSASR